MSSLQYSATPACTARLTTPLPMPGLIVPCVHSSHRTHVRSAFHLVTPSGPTSASGNVLASLTHYTLPASQRLRQHKVLPLIGAYRAPLRTPPNLSSQAVWALPWKSSCLALFQYRVHDFLKR